MKKINLLLLLLVAIYSSASLATSSYNFGGSGDWNKPGISGDWNKPGDWNKDKDQASCKPTYDVPEPGIIGLLAIGLLGMVVARRKLKNK